MAIPTAEMMATLMPGLRKVMGERYYQGYTEWRSIFGDTPLRPGTANNDINEMRLPVGKPSGGVTTTIRTPEVVAVTRRVVRSAREIDLDPALPVAAPREIARKIDIDG